MKEFLRKCRGLLGVSVMWGAAWAAIFAAVSVIVGLVDPASGDPGDGPIALARIGVVFGLVSGAAFGLIFALAERRKTILDLSLGRVALWGLLGTAVFPLLTQVDDRMVFIFGPIGAALAAASVAVARKAELASSPERPRLPGAKP